MDKDNQREKPGDGLTAGERHGIRRREWVKNAAIIFLSLMLVLTFFSNTIQNYSLPQVAAQYIQAGSITAKVRGTGTVEAQDPYKVQLQETRKIASVLVKAGEDVQKGQPLFLLEDAKSQELSQAQEELDQAILAFETALLSGELSGASLSLGGERSSVANYQSQILAAEDAVRQWEAKEAQWQKKSDELAMAIAKQGYVQADTTEESKKISALEQQKLAKEVQLKAVEEEMSLWTSKLQSLALAMEEEKIQIAALEAAKASVSAGDAATVDAQIAGKQTNIQNIEVQRQTIAGSMGEVQARLSAQQSDLAKIQLEIQAATKALESKQESKGAIANWSVDKIQTDQQLKEAQAQLAKAKEAKAKLISNIAKELNLDAQRETISRKQEKVAELTAKSLGATVEAPISGKILTVDISAGGETAPGASLATIQPLGKGYALSFSVSNDQAKKLSVGSLADAVNAWNYGNLTIRLTQIKPDPSDPGSKKLLTFSIEGDIAAGASLTISAGDKSAQYDMLVPNTALREDNNGKFILVVESKSSPLGNRYVASRVEVEVLASDDKQTAIKGALYGGEFVITTSTKPLEPGQLVRLADEQK